MGQFVASAAGAVAGFFIGGPAGAMWGWSLGGAAYSIFGPKQTIEGPRQHIRAPKLEFGSPYPRIYGTVRTAGLLLWASEKRETVHEEEVDKGSGPTSRTFTYSMDLIIGLDCPARVTAVLRAWRNGELIWSRHGESSAETLQASEENENWDSLTLRDGNATQMPWSVYAAAVGEENANAFRKRSTICIENFQLGQFTEIGLLEFEVTTASTESQVLVTPTWWVNNDVGGPGGGGIGTVSFNPSVDYILLPMWNASYLTNQFRIYTVTQGHETTFVGTGETEWSDNVANLMNGVSDISCLMTAHWNTRRYAKMQTADGALYLFDFGEDSINAFGSAWFVIRGDHCVFKAADDKLYRFSSRGGGILAQTADVVSGNIGAIAGDDYLYVSSGNTVKKYDLDTLTLIATYTAPFYQTVSYVMTNENSEVFYYTNTRLYEVVGSEFELLANPLLESPAAANFFPSIRGRSMYFWEANPNPPASEGQGVTWYGSVIHFATSPQTVDLADIVTAECALVGLTASQIDVSDLVGIEVRGFAAQGTAREAIEELMTIFYFGAFCADKIYFVLRGGASAKTIVFGRTGVGGDPFSGPERGGDSEVPEKWLVVAPDPLKDYDTGSEDSNRMVGVGVDTRKLEVRVVLTPDEAKGRAVTLAADARTSAHVGELNLDDYCIDLTPTDVVTVYDNDGNVYRVRMVKETYDARGTKKVEVVLDDAAILSLTGVTQITDQRSMDLELPGDSTLYLLDASILRDADNSHGAYWGVKGTGDWSSAILYSSDDGTTFSEEQAITSTLTVGSTQTALSSYTGPNIFDHQSTVRVLVNKELTSVTRDAALDSGANMFRIGNEWVQALDVTLVQQVGDDAFVYDLKTFLRGRRGTEHAMSGHAAGETVFLVNSAARRLPLTAANRDVERYYKAVTNGRTVSSADTETFTNTDIGLKPFSPVNLRCERLSTGDLKLTWDRRSRLIGEFPSGTDIPLGETTEAYEVDIMNGATVLRTIECTSAQAIYTRADQVTDFGGAVGSVSVNVYQLSSIVGRGYPLAATGTSGYTPVAQTADITLSGTFAVGIVISVSAGSTTLATYTTVTGDVNLNGVATSLAAAIDANASYAAAAVGAVVTVTGPVGVEFELEVAVSGGSVLGFNLEQTAAYANPGTMYIGNVFIANPITGITEPIPAGTPLYLIVERPYGNHIGTVTYTTAASETKYQALHGLAHEMNLHALYALGYRFQVVSNSAGYYGQLLGPIGVPDIFAKSSGGPFTLSITVQQPGSAPVPTDRPQVVSCQVLGTPTSGEISTVTLNGEDFTYTTAPGDTVNNVATGLAADIDPDPDYTASAVGAEVTITGLGPANPFTFTGNVTSSIVATVS